MGTVAKRAVYRDEEAQERLEQWFLRFLEKIPGSVESQTIETRFGASHVLMAGDPDAPPLVALHAMRTSSAFLLSELAPLLDRFRIVAPDLPGQSVRGLPLQMPLTDDSHTQWLTDLLDELGLETVDLFGVSWGGFVGRQLATLASDRVRRLALLVPAGIANGSHWTGLIKMALPLTAYRLHRTKKNLERMLAPLFTTWDDDWAEFMGDTVRDMPFDFRIPPLATDEELRGLTVPVFVLAATDDISFPGETVVRRILESSPNARGEVIPGCKHCPPATPEFRVWLADRLAGFYGELD